VQTYLSGYVCNLRRTYVPAGKNRAATLDGVRGGVPYTEVATTESAGQADAQILTKNLERQNTLPGFAANGLSLLFTRGMSHSGHGATRFVYQGGWGGGRCLAITPCPSLGKCGSLAPAASWSGITVYQLNEASTDPCGDRCGRADLRSVAARPLGRNSPPSGGTAQGIEDNHQMRCADGTRRDDQKRHTIRAPTGEWWPPDGRGGQKQNDPGTFTDIDCNGAGNPLQQAGRAQGPEHRRRIRDLAVGPISIRR
jgi:hypothetical protein